MLTLVAFQLMLAQLQQEGPLTRAYILGGGSEPPPNRQKMSEIVRKNGRGAVWKDLPDGKLIYLSPKQVSFVFQPSLREIRSWQNLKFFRRKIEHGGFWAKFRFDELPDQMKEQLRSTLPNLDFKPDSMVVVGPKIVANISGAGRKLNIPSDLVRPQAQSGPSAPKISDDMTPVEEKQNKPSQAENQWLPFYQFWNLNVGFDGQRTEVVQEMLTLLNAEMSKRTDVEKKALFDLLKDNRQFKDYQSRVGKFASRPSDAESESQAARSIYSSLNVFRGALGLDDNKDWDNFTQQASVSSISLGFSVSVVTMVKGRRQLVGVGF
jgi:hypothetical protein